MGKYFKSRFGDENAQYAGFSDGNESENRETASGECELLDQYSSGIASEHWGARSVNS